MNLLARKDPYIKSVEVTYLKKMVEVNKEQFEKLIKQNQKIQEELKRFNQDLFDVGLRMTFPGVEAGSTSGCRTSINQKPGGNLHNHTCVVDSKGDGETSFDEGHSHMIVGFVIQEADGHSHVLN